MATRHLTRSSIVLVLAIALLGAACTSSTEESVDTATTTTIDAEAERTTAMCRTLDLLSNAGATPGSASLAITDTDLVGLTTTEQAEYGDLLISAPRAECTEHIAYADEIAYWLGF
jgi:ABC-type Fe3+-hydroxamate transport system substrate-binding protein